MKGEGEDNCWTEVAGCAVVLADTKARYCCSATVGEGNCFTSTLVTFDLQEVPGNGKRHYYNQIGWHTQRQSLYVRCHQKTTNTTNNNYYKTTLNTSN